MNATETMDTAGQRREVVVDVLAETLLEMLLQGRAADAEPGEAEQQSARAEEPPGPQSPEVCDGAG